MKQGHTKILENTSIIFVIICSMLIIATFLFSMPLGMTLFYFTEQGAAVGREAAIGLPIYYLVLFTAKIPWEVGLNGLFLVVWIIFAVCLAIAWKGPSKGVRNAVRDALSGKPQNLFSNSLIALVIFACFLSFLVTLLQGIQESHGIPTGEVTFPNEFEGFLSVSYASVIEEIGFRVTPIGVYLLIYMLMKKSGQIFKEPFRKSVGILALSVVYPEGAKRRLGLKTFKEQGFTGVAISEWIVIISTSLAFGAAHYFSGSGWGPGKISSASLVGFVMALGYVVYGVHFPILVHWFFNYYSYALYLGGKVYGSMFLLNAFLDPFTSIFGGVLIAFLAWSLYERRREHRNESEAARMPLNAVIPADSRKS